MFNAKDDQLRKSIFLSGATGYVGSRLLPLIESQGHHVRCFVRQAARLHGLAESSTEIVEGDVLDETALTSALQGIDTAFYLVHSMGSVNSFEKEDRRAATNFAKAAQACGVKRIIYLGGLGEDSSKLSKHLRSRHEVGEILRTSGCEVLELRASIVIGAGSLSFELVRALVQRLPVMICPKWVAVKAQPIAIDDLLQYLIGALNRAPGESRIFEIGGPDQVSYGEIMREYARQRGLKRWLISVPILTPRLSSLWLGLVTPVYARVGRKLVDSLKNSTIINDASSQHEFDVRPRGIRASIEQALQDEEQQLSKTRWSDALSSSRGVRSWAGIRFGSRIIDSRTIDVSAAPDKAFTPIRTYRWETRLVLRKLSLDHSRLD